jgi:hypothetical protein
MSVRSLLAFLLLANYLLLAGIGGIARPFEQQELVFVQTYEGQQYQECRYLRMDGLEEFLKESLSTRCQEAPSVPPHHVMAVVMAVDAHCLPELSPFSFLPAYPKKPISDTYLTNILQSVKGIVSPPPKKA